MTDNTDNSWTDWYKPKNPFVNSSENTSTDEIRRVNPSLFKPAETSIKLAENRLFLFIVWYIESLKRKSLEACAQDFVMSLKKSAITRSITSLPRVAQQQSSNTSPSKRPISMWDEYISDDHSTGSSLIKLWVKHRSVGPFHT